MTSFSVLCISRLAFSYSTKNTLWGDLCGGPVLKTLPSGAGSMGLMPGLGVKSYMPCGRETKTWNRSNSATSSIKILKWCISKKKNLLYLENYFSFTNAGNIFAILIFAWIVITFLTGLCFLFWLFFLAKIYRVMCIFLYTGLPHCRHILYQLSHKGSPRILEWVSYPFSRFSWPRDLTWGILHCRQILYQRAIREALLAMK